MPLNACLQITKSNAVYLEAGTSQAMIILTRDHNMICNVCCPMISFEEISDATWAG